jgi:release factor glutamine methyltransferase
VSAPRTVAELRREIAATLTNSDSSALDARLIVAHALGMAPDAVLFHDDDAIGGAAMVRARNLAHRRAQGEPVARIVGEKEFYGLTFGLSPDTLVPRPDTEALVDAVVELVDRDSAVAILDLGTGSGAILLALLSQLPNAAGVGVDISAGAIATAAGNARRFGLDSRAAFAVGNWASGITTEFAVVVSNPPYIAHGEIAGLPVEVRDHDPHVSLDGGDDGLDAIRAILSDIERVLAPSGAAFVEIGFGQADAVASLAAKHGFKTTFRRDLAGIERVAILSRESAVG